MGITLLLVDSHKIMRDGLRSLIETRSDMNIVGEANNGIRAVELARELHPDVVIMDIGMPEMDGIEATRIITDENPKIKVVALSLYSNKQYVVGMLRAGASGYVLKDNAFRDLNAAVRSVLRNKLYLSDKISHIDITEYQNNLLSEEQEDQLLTARENEVLRLLATGYTIKEIALRLRKSPKTIDACRQQIMTKMNFDNLAELVKYAIREGLTSLDD
ncbi:MAG: response regulator transcription factor [Sedimentisphaerales bacterium]|nr:response regulator transcription factor [Sedimentisphaerales bacterium]